MRIFISADLEGITGITSWEETTPNSYGFNWAREQMTREVAAAARGALRAGASEIFIKDAHGDGRNLILDQLPEKTRVISGWAGGPKLMMSGLDSSFDGIIFIGYHSPAGGGGNPLSHTFSYSEVDYVKINGRLASEFLFNTYIGSLYGVSPFLISGDEEICKEAKKLVPNIKVVPVKTGLGGSCTNINPQEACDLIEKKTYEALKNQTVTPAEMPSAFHMEIKYRKHEDAYKASFFPKVRGVDSHTVEILTDSFYDLLITKMFIL